MLVALLTLANILNYLKEQKVDITKVCVAELLTIIYTNDYYPADQEIWQGEILYDGKRLAQRIFKLGWTASRLSTVTLIL